VGWRRQISRSIKRPTWLGRKVVRGLWRLVVSLITLMVVAGLLWAARFVAELRYSGEYGFDFFPYGVSITLTMAAALLALLAYALHRRRAWLMCAPLLLSLVGYLFLAGLHEIHPEASARSVDVNLMLDLQAVALPQWRDAHGVYPATLAELREALRLADSPHGMWRQGELTRSHYLRQGRALSYEFVVLNNAAGPMLSAQATRPAVLYYAIAADRRSWWLTMSGPCRQAPCRPQLLGSNAEPVTFTAMSELRR